MAGLVQELPFRDESFDVEVSLYGGIHYLPYLESEYRSAFKEIIRTLKPSGKAYLFPVNVNEKDKDSFQRLLQEFSSQTQIDAQFDLVEKRPTTGDNIYRVILIKKTEEQSEIS